MLPSLAITIDTTPSFHGEAGIAFYCHHWEFNSLEPSDALITATRQIEDEFTKIHPELKVRNGWNDYLMYGKICNEYSDVPIPSIAIEPAIFPYHQVGERVFLDDIENVAKIVMKFLKASEK